MAFKVKIINKKYCLALLMLGIFSTIIHAQKIDGICSEVSFFGNSLQKNKLEYLKYQPVLQLKVRYSSFDQVKNTTPEELIISQMSALDNNWLSYNFENKINWTDQQFERIRTQDKNKNYLELVRKVTYTLNNIMIIRIIT